MKVFLQGHGEVSLTQNDFVATGGQASVYVQGGMAYKVYTDPKDAIPAEKFHALSTITDPAVVKPKTLLLDGRGTRIGYAMDAVTAPHSLCQLFTPAFRDRHKVGAEKIPRVAAKLRSHVQAVHQAGIVVVDLNELNILVPDTFDETFLIDVDSYQTSQFPATVIMPSVRDWSTKKFSAESDWYSYAILAFQLFVGAHPFKGSLKHPEIGAVPKDGRLEWRMRRNLSAFRKEASLPPCCPPLSSIPGHFKDWLEAVLDGGLRLPPPDPGALPAPMPVRAPPRALSSEGELLVELQSDAGQFIAGYDDSLLLLRKDGVPTVMQASGFGLRASGSESGSGSGRPPTADPRPPSWSGAWMADLGTGQTCIGRTPKMNHPVAFCLQGETLTFYDFERQTTEAAPLYVNEIAKSGERFYVRSGSGVYELGLSERPSRILVTTSQKVADVLPRASRLFEGCAIQSLLGSTFVSLFPRTKAGYQVRMAELDGVKVLDAKFQACKGGGALCVLGARAGKYARFVFRFDEDYAGYDVRVVDDVEPDLLNFVVLPHSGVAVLLGHEDVLEVFVAVRGKTLLRQIQSPLLGADLRLVRVGDGIGFTRGNELYRLRLK